MLQYVWVVQDYDYHIDFTGSTTGTGLVIWDRAADDLEGEEAVRGGQRDDTTTWAAFCAVAQMVWRQHPVSNTAWLCYVRTRVLWRDVNHHAARRDKV